MHKKRHKAQKKSGMPMRIITKKTPKERLPSEPVNIYWPDRIDHVRAIAARGLSDDEMAVMLGVSEKLLDSWRKFYPEFNKAIDEGRSEPDMQVIAALHKSAIGFEREEDVVVRTRKGAQIVTAKKFYPGETAAQRYWLNNRAPKVWKDRQEHAVMTPKGDAVRVRNETKDEVINSLLNMITPRPDNAVG